MPNSPVKNTNFTWLRLLLATLLVLGIFFRLVNLDRKVYSYDEGFTSLRVGGYFNQEVVQQTFNSQVISVADFRQYLGPNPHTSFLDTMRSLAIEDPQHPPLYYLMTRLWMQLFGNSVAAIRSLPALISLLAFPCVYWLCLELFKSPPVGWMAIALLAVSPFHVLYAQEAREYSLWTVTILLSSAALLRAIRLKTRLSWGLYALTLATALYSFLFSVFVAIAHGIYVIVTQIRLSKTVINYLIATLVGFLAFAPWIWVAIANYPRLQASTNWMTDRKLPPLHLARMWIQNLGIIFINSGELERILFLLILLLVGYAIYFLCRNTSIKVWLFLLTLFGVTSLALALPDLISGGQISTMPRFLIPCYLSIQIIVAYLLSTKMTKPIVRWQQGFWLFVTIALFAGGVFSSGAIAQSEITWNRVKNAHDANLARTIHVATKPLVVVNNFQTRYDSNISYLFSFSHLLDAKVKLQLVPANDIPKIPAGFSDIFIYNPCAAQESKRGLDRAFQKLQAGLKQGQNYKLEPVKISQPVLLWRVIHSS